MIHYTKKELGVLRDVLGRLKKKDKTLRLDEINHALRVVMSGEDQHDFDVLMAFVLGAAANETVDQKWLIEALGIKE